MTEPELSREELAIQQATRDALEHGGTNPWGRIRVPLARAAGLAESDVRAIGMQDDSVINRAVTSPGMTKPNLQVHGFVIQPDTTLSTVLETVTANIEQLPNLRTAVLITADTGYRPSHVLSRDAIVAARLADSLPHANVVSDLSRTDSPGALGGSANTSAHRSEGPWLVHADAEALQQHATVVAVGLDERHVRDLSPGDKVLIVGSGVADRAMAYAAGVLASLTLSGVSIVLGLQPCEYFQNGPVPLLVVEDGVPAEPHEFPTSHIDEPVTDVSPTSDGQRNA